MAKRQSAALQRIYDAKGAQNVLLLVRSSTVHIACMKSGNATTYAFPLYTNNEKANTQPSLHEMTNCKASTDIDDPDIIHLLVHIQERFLYHYILTMRPILTLKLHSYRYINFPQITCNHINIGSHAERFLGMPWRFVWHSRNPHLTERKSVRLF